MSPHGAEDDRDPAMTSLMTEWGASVRHGTEPIIERPPDLPELRARLDAIDDELAAATPFASRGLRLAAASAAAAAVLVATTWLAFRGDARAPRLAGVRAVEVVETGGVARSAPSVFKTGARVDVRFDSDGPAAIRVATLAPDGTVRSLAATALDAAGLASVGPFVLVDPPGVETFVVIAGPRDAGAAEIDALLAAASDAARAAPARPLDAALERIRRDGRFSAEALPLRHER